MLCLVFGGSAHLAWSEGLSLLMLLKFLDLDKENKSVLFPEFRFLLAKFPRLMFTK